jgi:ubiquinone/menaquinone biosynthesis C-methylase UbiE
MTQKIQKFWDKNAKRYDKSEQQSESVNQEIIAKTVKYLYPDDHVLDFGCATGTKAIELANKVRHIHGLDFSGEMIQIANKKKDELQIPNISFSRGTIFSNELEPVVFDKIVSYVVIHLLKDKEEVIRRIYELLKPGGLFISATACFKDKMAFKKSIEVKSYLLMQKLGIFPLHLNIFTTTDVEKLMTDQGFRIIEAERIFHEISISFVVAERVNSE